jgi:phosphopantothenoylcysteine decarboxylase/phosphopantothenate--cysteine ligase
VRIRSAQELHDAVEARASAARAVLMAAAVADQRPAEVSAQKVKKTEGEELLRLVRTPDILAGLGQRFAGAASRPVLVGFAAETERLEESAREKLQRKQLDLIVANDVSRAGAGFGAETNHVVVLEKDGARTELSGSKREVADGILDRLKRHL